METEQPNQENPDNLNTEEQGSSQVRSYECTFCKRGFSNAQALGGHMNIHRKDKARLKHPSSNELQQSLNIPKILSPSFSPIPTSITHPPMQAKSSQDASSIKWRPWFLDNESDDASKRTETRVGEIQQLSLFADKPSAEDHHQQQPNSDQDQGSNEQGFSSSQSLSSSELDLELRLGPEPQDSLPAASTKRFF